MTRAEISDLPGFDDPVMCSQRIFRMLLDAMSSPGKVINADLQLVAPAPLLATSAAICLTLLDRETPLWLDAKADQPQVREYLRFHCGCHLTRRAKEALFALIANPQSVPVLDQFKLGTDEEPEHSATLIIQVEALASEGELKLTGPGIETARRLHIAPFPPSLSGQVVLNQSLFPRGLDFIFASPNQVAAIPRSGKIEVQ
jgi:alpha-D-ribose 1-methylphosphonate 5-triphosphate synthase subunit PhnH